MRDVAGLLFKCLGQSQCQCSHDRLADGSPVAPATWRARCAESAPTTVRVCLVETVPLPGRLDTQHCLRIRAQPSPPTPATPLSCVLRQRAFCVLAQPSQGSCPQHTPTQPDVTCPRAHSLRPAMALVAALWPPRRSRSARRRTPARPAPYSLYASRSKEPVSLTSCCVLGLSSPPGCCTGSDLRGTEGPLTPARPSPVRQGVDRRDEQDQGTRLGDKRGARGGPRPRRPPAASETDECACVTARHQS